MRYLLLINSDREYLASATPAEFEALMPEYLAFSAMVQESGEFVDGSPLQDSQTATTVRVRGDESLVTDGPFAETKEILGGYYLLDCKDLDRAIELAGRIPAVRNGSVEIRPLAEM